MKIDWKVLAASDGYRLFKSKYILYRMYRHSRDSKEAHKLFMKVIGVAQSKTVNANIPNDSRTLYMASLLSKWAKEQNYNWLGYFSKFEKENSGSVKPRSSAKYLKKYFHCKERRMSRIAEAQRELRVKSGKKARWTKNQKEYAIYRKEQELRMRKKSL